MLAAAFVLNSEIKKIKNITFWYSFILNVEQLLLKKLTMKCTCMFSPSKHMNANIKQQKIQLVAALIDQQEYAWISICYDA